MRGRFAGALLLGVAGIAAANAADLTGGRGGYRRLLVFRGADGAGDRL